jgi:hypothetical protein
MTQVAFTDTITRGCSVRLDVASHAAALERTIPETASLEHVGSPMLAGSSMSFWRSAAAMR